MIPSENKDCDTPVFHTYDEAVDKICEICSTLQELQAPKTGQSTEILVSLQSPTTLQGPLQGPECIPQSDLSQQNTSHTLYSFHFKHVLRNRTV